MATLHLSAPTAARRLAIAPAFRALPPPTIIIGMHRTGTSLTAGLLTILGAAMAPEMPPPREGTMLAVPDSRLRREGYAEAHAFRLLNETLLAHAGASWDHVEPFLAQRDSPFTARWNLLRMQAATYTNLQSGFLKPLAIPAGGAWGWKDPRNSLTLPYWLRLFPDARVLHVRRDPQHVADSLIKRAQHNAVNAGTEVSSGSRLRRALRDPEVLVRFAARRLHLAPAVSPAEGTVLDRDYCLRLTEQYERECLAYHRLGGQYREVWFEEILRDPVGMTQTLADFVGMPVSSARMEEAVAFVQYDGGGQGQRTPQRVREAGCGRK